jgi:hypothetical protein
MKTYETSVYEYARRNPDDYRFGLIGAMRKAGVTLSDMSAYVQKDKIIYRHKETGQELFDLTYLHGELKFTILKSV